MNNNIKEQMKSHWPLAKVNNHDKSYNNHIYRIYSLDEIINIRARFRRDYLFFINGMDMKSAARMAGLSFAANRHGY